MNEGFKRCVGDSLMDSCNLFERKFPCKDKTREAHIGKKTGFGRIADVALGACMKFNRRNIHPQDTHVLDNERVNSGPVQLSDKLLHRLQLIIINDGVDSRKNLCIETMGIVDHTSYVSYGIGGCMARAMTRRTHVDGIGSGCDSSDCDVGIACRCKQFKRGGDSFAHYLKI